MEPLALCPVKVTVEDVNFGPGKLTLARNVLRYENGDAQALPQKVEFLLSHLLLHGTSTEVREEGQEARPHVYCQFQGPDAILGVETPKTRDMEDDSEDNDDLNFTEVSFYFDDEKELSTLFQSIKDVLQELDLPLEQEDEEESEEDDEDLDEEAERFKDAPERV